ncbi:MAG: DUF1343 domain-containing protein [Culturomica sp.]|jgi:uncharacterized protein YbbC (DUF1343 family)|nr:DUF1343 domain-containing protein [Culturomica sp.]
MVRLLHTLALLGCLLFTCSAQTESPAIIVGAERTELYLPLLAGKRIAVAANHTSLVKGKHLVDMLHESGFNVALIIAAEHGFRGDADAGEKVGNSTDAKTGIPIFSLYNGKTTRPDRATADKFDVLIFDIQDVGTRFYTYYITMTRLMDACAEYGKEMIVLDRPNPNGHYVDGPILNMKYKSGVGWLPIPVVHGMTLGELAQMINGENWLPEHRKCKITVVPCLNYNHHTFYHLPVPPSPNLPDMQAVYLYSSLCFFEGTPVSIGRGTDLPFQVYGHPKMHGYGYSFTPRSVAGAKNPPCLNQKCYGTDLSQLPQDSLLTQGINLSYLIDAYNNLQMGDAFFTPFFEKLIGVSYVREMIQSGASAQEIHSRWQPDIRRFLHQRHPYLLYAE